MFYTTDPKTSLTNGERIPFDVTADSRWQTVAIDLPTSGRIFQLRIDASDGPGTATLSQIHLTTRTTFWSSVGRKGNRNPAATDDTGVNRQSQLNASACHRPRPWQRR